MGRNILNSTGRPSFLPFEAELLREASIVCCSLRATLCDDSWGPGQPRATGHGLMVPWCEMIPPKSDAANVIILEDEAFIRVDGGESHLLLG